MSLILPFSDASQYATGGIWAPTAANFPVVKHFWSCPQSDIGGTQLTDVMGTAHLVKSSGTIETPATPDGFSVLPTQAAGGIATISGTLAVVGTKNCILMAVGIHGNTATAGFAIGTPSSVGSSGIRTATGGSNSIRDNSDNTLATTAYTGSTTVIYGRALAITWAGNAVPYEATTTTTITTLAGTATSAGSPASVAGGITTISPSWSSGSVILNLHGAMLLVFDGALPSSAFIASLVAWTTYQWSVGNKRIYPGLKGWT